MIIRKYVNSQSGAALILVLFAVLFLSVIGTVLLNSTTYSLKSNVKNEEIQAEFYRAEGAIDLVIEEMEAYEGNDVSIQLEDSDGNLILDEDDNPIIVSVQEQGPFFYLNDLPTPTTITKTIGDKEMIVTVNKEKSDTDPNIYHATLKAKYLNDHSNVVREVDLDVRKNNRPTLSGGTRLSKPVYYKENFNYNGSEQHDRLDIKNNKEQISSEVYENILSYLGYPVTYDNLWNITDSYTFSTGTHKPNQIDFTGKGKTLIIPQGATVFVKNVNLGGSGNTKVQIQIDGILVAENFTMSGNATVRINGALIVTSNLNKMGGGNDSAMEINSGIIAKNIATSGKNNFSGDAKGIDCSLLGLTGTLCGGPSDPNTFIPEDNPWTSSIDKIEYDTFMNE